jgi:hypothetical protein
LSHNEVSTLLGLKGLVKIQHLDVTHNNIATIV